MTIRVAEVPSAVTAALRLAVLRPSAAPDAPAPGDAPDAVHLAAYDGDRLVGAAVVLPVAFPARPDVPAVQLRGMAVAPDTQGSGVGSRLLVAVDVLATARGVSTVWCNARSIARAFYERNGFRVEGEEFVVAEIGIPHYVMWRSVEPDGGTTSS